MTQTNDNAAKTQNNVRAIWTGEEYVAYFDENGEIGSWFSSDGDWWNDVNGKAIVTREFNQCSITLVGGPRDGSILS